MFKKCTVQTVWPLSPFAMLYCTVEGAFVHSMWQGNPTTTTVAIERERVSVGDDELRCAAPLVPLEDYRSVACV